MGILQGTHKYLVDSLKGKHDGPTVDELFDIFDVFSKNSIKRYIFKRIKKRLNLELAIAIIQDLIANGAGREKTLNLEVVHLAANGKQVVIADKFATPGETPLSEKDFEQIDEAVMHLSPNSAKAKPKRIALGKKHGSPLKEADMASGYFTPNGKDPAKRQGKFEVSAHAHHSKSPDRNANHMFADCRRISPIPNLETAMTGNPQNKRPALT